MAHKATFAPAEGLGFTAEDVRGLEDTLWMLEKWSPDLALQLNLEMRAVMREVAAKGKALFPIGPGRNEDGHGKYGFSVRKSRSFIGYTAVSRRKSGVILEFAGRRSGGRTARGRSLIATLNARYGATSRFLWAAWDAQAPEAIARVIAKSKELEAVYTARLAAKGGGA